MPTTMTAKAHFLCHMKNSALHWRMHVQHRPHTRVRLTLCGIIPLEQPSLLLPTSSATRAGIAPSTFFTPSSRLARAPTPTMLGQSRFFRWQKVPGNDVPVLASATSATLQSSLV